MREQIDARGARQHRVHEPLVARHVDHRQPAAAREIEPRIAERDRDPARTLLGQPVGVHARQPAHERRLAVVDVPRCRA
jgi:hypothetical protein